jgi:hypothetical protein
MNQRVETKQMQVNLFPVLGLRLLRQRDMCHCQPQGKKQRVDAKKKNRKHYLQPRLLLLLQITWTLQYVITFRRRFLDVNA